MTASAVCTLAPAARPWAGLPTETQKWQCPSCVSVKAATIDPASLSRIQDALRVPHRAGRRSGLPLQDGIQIEEHGTGMASTPRPVGVRDDMANTGENHEPQN